MARLSCLFLLFTTALGVDFSVDLKGQRTNFPHLWESSVGSCHATTALRQDWRSQLSGVKRDIGFEMVRFHGLLDDDMSVVLDNGTPSGTYSFFNIDSVFDFLVSIGMKPFVELSFMPEHYASGSDTVFHYKGNITPPKNYGDWNKFISALMQHLIDRYTLEVVASWYFEVWNEPNCGFFYQGGCCGEGCGNQTAYFTLYQNTAQAIKSVDKSLRVGGPATAQLGWINEFLDFVKSNNVPADFVSSHLYPTDPQANKVASGFSDAIAAAAQTAAAGGLPFLLTEYNPGLGLGVADEPYTAAFSVYEANATSKISNLAAYSFWTFSDIFEEGGQNSAPYSDQFGLETIYNVPKPGYRAFQLLHELSTSRLPVQTTEQSTVLVIATIEDVDGGGSVLTLLLTNFEYYQKPISAVTVNITLQNVPGKLSTMADLRRIDDTHANGITVWKNAGSPTYPSSQLISDMIAASKLVVEEVAVTPGSSGQYTISLTLPPYGTADIKVNIPASASQVRSQARFFRGP